MDSKALTALARPELTPARATAHRGWWARLGAAAFGLLLLYPLAGLFARVGGWQWSGSERAASLASIRVSLELTGWAMLLVVLLGTPMALYIRRAGRREQSSRSLRPIKPRPAGSRTPCSQPAARPQSGPSAVFARLREVRGVAEGAAGHPAPAKGVEALGRRLAAGPGRGDSLRHLRVLPRRPAVTAPWPAWVRRR